MQTALLSIAGLTLETSQGPIITELSFNLKPGEIVALTGPSGSGKSSVALAILDMLPTGIQWSAGQIHWSPDPHPGISLPHDAAAWRSLRGRDIGYIQQNPYGAFDPVINMGVQMMMIIRERTRLAKQEIYQLLHIKMEEVGLHEIDRLLASYPHQLSGGQLQRCQIAMSLVMGPKLLIADEPTSAIDKINQGELLRILLMLRSKYNMAILCISHDEDVVRMIADREVALGDPVKDAPPLPDRAHLPVSIISPPHLEIKGLSYSHRFGGILDRAGAVIGPVGFSISGGSCLGIAGESGSGKSTLALMLVGHWPPSSGHLKLQGKEIDFSRPMDVQTLRTKVQLVLQDGRGSLHPDMSIRTLMNEVLLLAESEPGRRLTGIESHLRKVGLPASILDRTAAQLSGGECLRVNIARALLMEPAVLICDESTAALDSITRDSIIRLLIMLMESQGLAVILISHDKSIIQALAHHILVMSEGKVVEQGPAEDILHRPTHPVTQKIFRGHATQS